MKNYRYKMWLQESQFMGMTVKRWNCSFLKDWLYNRVQNEKNELARFCMRQKGTDTDSDVCERNECVLM